MLLVVTCGDSEDVRAFDLKQQQGTQASVCCLLMMLGPKLRLVCEEAGEEPTIAEACVWFWSDRK